MATTNPSALELSEEDRLIIEGWLLEFDRSWAEGRLAERARLLPPLGSPLRFPALVEMVKIDLERLWQRGQRVTVESYLSQYPELGTPDAVPPDLIQAEYEVRLQFGAPAKLTEFARRFPSQAEDLRRLVSPAGEVTAELGSGITPLSPSELSTFAEPLKQTRAIPESFGRYRVIKRLGRGEMGAVYLARDTQLDRLVALKVPHFTSADSPELLQRFHLEARAAATLHHPHLCAVFDVGQIDGIHYLTMAYIEGKPLAAFLKGGKPLPQVQAAAVIRKLAQAMAEAHRHGVIHRDLKPSNIFINNHGEPVIVDFGLARRTGQTDARLTKSGAILGTPAYMSPEQVTGDLEALGPRCDIYSLGAVLYELVTGQLPFQGNVMAVLARILNEEPPPPSAHRPDLDADLEAICLRAMAKKPEDRYATMGELATALTAYLRSERKSAKSTYIQELTEGPRPLEENGPWPDEDDRVTQLAQGPADKAKTTIVPRSRPPRWPWIVLPAGTVALAFLGILLYNLFQQDTDGPPLSGRKYSVETVKILGQHSHPVACVAFHPQGDWAISAGDDGIRLWNLQTLAEGRPPFKGRTKGVNSVAFSPDGRHVLSGNDNGQVQLFDFKSGALIRTFEKSHLGRVNSVAFSADGNRAVSGGMDPNVRVWDPTTGQEIGCLKGHPQEVLAVALSPKGDRVLSSAKDKDGSIFWLWSVTEGRILNRLQEKTRFYGITSIVFFADGQRALCGSYDDNVTLWSLAGDKSELSGHGDSVLSVALSPNERRALSGCNDGTILLWDVKARAPIPGFQATGHQGPVSGVAISPDGKYALSGGKDKTVRLWSLPSVAVRKK